MNPTPPRTRDELAALATILREGDPIEPVERTEAAIALLRRARTLLAGYPDAQQDLSMAIASALEAMIKARYGA